LDRLSGEIQPALVAVLSDINMPGMDGLQLLAEIKQRFPDRLLGSTMLPTPAPTSRIRRGHAHPDTG